VPVLDLDTLQVALTQASARWRPRQNIQAELNDGQKRALLGVIVEPKSLTAAMAPAAGAPPAPNFAPAVDWRNRNGNHVTGVKDQRNCGSCVSFCTTGVTESMVSIEKGSYWTSPRPTCISARRTAPVAAAGGPTRHTARSSRAA
jgi:C1A family cysteine protease